MERDEPKKNKEKIFRAIMAVILAAIIIISVLFVFIYTKNEAVPQTYSNKDKAEVLDLLNNSIDGYDEVNEEYIYNLSKIDLTIIDCRGLEGCSSCQFKKGHLPGAVLNDNYKSLYYNETNDKNDILVYSKDGTVGASFCENLTGHVYGKLYNLEGGYNAWVAAGYPIEKGS
jgi:rhodanese-related sulfurtransferase